MLMRVVCRQLLTILCTAVLSGSVSGADSSDTAGQAASYADLRRLTEEQYRRSIADIFGADITIAGRFEQERRTAGLLAIDSTSGSYSPSGFEQYEQTARAIAAQVTDADHRSTLIPCAPADTKTANDACAQRFLASAGAMLYRRPLGTGELSVLTGLAGNTARNLKDFYAGLQAALATMLVSPRFLFRLESATANPATPGAYQLDAYSKATRLSYLLWNSTPDEVLLQAAGQGRLDTPKGLAAQVERMMHSPKLEAGVRAFFSDMLGFDGYANLSKDTVIYPRFDSAVSQDSREEVLRLITDHLLRQDKDYRDLFTTRRSFLTRRLGLIYKVPVQNRYGWTAYEFSAEDHRDGMLTRLSFLALHSHPGRSSPTLRGKAVRELLLCQSVPAPPANVDFALLQDTSNPQFRTARARLAKHNEDAVCAGCHKLTDPLGLPLETFDSSGELRVTENGAPIDASGALGKQTFADATGMGQALRDDPQAADCVVTRTYNYATGRATSKTEREFVRELSQGFAADGYRYAALLRRIVLSDEFYRLRAPAAEPQNVVADVNVTAH
jgi:hypothetical protein